MAIPAEYAHWLERSLAVFRQKRQQYGESWQVLSLPSLIDLLFIKARRLQTLYSQNRAETPATGESPIEDLLSLVNYSAIALMVLQAQSKAIDEATESHLSRAFELAQDYAMRKNADYGDAWRDMRPLAYVEFILMKLARIRQMDSDPARHQRAIQDNLIDIINYALLFLCRYGDKTRTA